MKLNELAIAKPARITAFAAPKDDIQKGLIRTMMEMGLTPGANIIIEHTGPVGRDPLAVSCRGALIGIGKREAELILVEEVRA